MSTPNSSHLIAQWFSENRNWLHARLAGWLNCRHAADDLVSETFLRVLSMPDPDQVREPRALLTTVARRLAQESWRRRDLERAYLQVLQGMPEQVQPSPEDAEILLQTLLRIDRLLDTLPGQGKAAFIHSQIGGLTYAQIAGRLGISLSRVQQYMTEAFTLCYGALAE